MSKKTPRELILFMPFIGGGGVEKNLFIIGNYLSNKIKKIKICTLSNNQKKKFNKNIQFISPKKNIPSNTNIRIQYLISLFLLFKYLKKNRNVMVLSFQANIYCVLLCKLFNIPIIIRSNSSPSGWYHNIIKKFIYKKIISLADQILVNSLEFKKEMDEKFNVKTYCIFNPLNKMEIIRKAKKKIKNKIFYKDKKILKLINIARFTDQKDQITLLKAAKILKEKIKFKLFLVGRGINKNSLENFISQNNLSKNVKIMDFAQNPYPLIKQSDIFLLSSKYEGLPNVLLEALALRKIVISSKCPTGPTEILLNGKGGILFKVGDFNELVKKIIFCKNNKTKVNKLISHGYNNLKRYDYQSNLDKYYFLINRYLLKK